MFDSSSWVLFLPETFSGSSLSSSAVSEVSGAFAGWEFSVDLASLVSRFSWDFSCDKGFRLKSFYVNYYNYKNVKSLTKKML